MRSADRIRTLPPYLFAELDKKLAAKREAGADIISLGVGDPDLPTPDAVVDAMREAVGNPATHRYPSYYGSPEFRDAIAESVVAAIQRLHLPEDSDMRTGQFRMPVLTA